MNGLPQDTHFGRETFQLRRDQICQTSSGFHIFILNNCCQVASGTEQGPRPLASVFVIEWAKTPEVPGERPGQFLKDERKGIRQEETRAPSYHRDPKGQGARTMSHRTCQRTPHDDHDRREGTHVETIGRFPASAFLNNLRIDPNTQPTGPPIPFFHQAAAWHLANGSLSATIFSTSFSPTSSEPPPHCNITPLKPPLLSHLFGSTPNNKPHLPLHLSCSTRTSKQHHHPCDTILNSRQNPSFGLAPIESLPSIFTRHSRQVSCCQHHFCRQQAAQLLPPPVHEFMRLTPDSPAPAYLGLGMCAAGSSLSLSLFETWWGLY